MCVVIYQGLVLQICIIDDVAVVELGVPRALSYCVLFVVLCCMFHVCIWYPHNVCSDLSGVAIGTIDHLKYPIPMYIHSNARTNSITNTNYSWSV